MENELANSLRGLDLTTQMNLVLRYLVTQDKKNSIYLLLQRHRRVEQDYYIQRAINRNEAVIELNSVYAAFLEILNEISLDLNLYQILIKEIKNHRKNERSIFDNFSLFNRNKSFEEKHAETTFSSIVKDQETFQSGRYNIVVVGKTGVGKSSLINYLFDNSKVRKTGVGKPVTEKGFHQVDMLLNGIPATLFDSWGLELDNSEKWIESLEKELRNRGIDTPASNWFHTILYCVAASGSRIEDFEIEIIKKFIENRYNVVIVFTKSDLAEQSDIDGLKSSISKEISNLFTYCEVCSEEKQLRHGKTEKFGSNELYSIINQGFWDSITLRLPDRCINILIKIIETWENQQYGFIKKFTGNYNATKVYDEIEKNSRALVEELESRQCSYVISTEIQKTIEMYENFSKILDLSSIKRSNEFRFKDMVVNKHDYATEKVGDVVLTVLTAGLPALFGWFKSNYKNRFDKMVGEFSTNLKKLMLTIRPDIEIILRKMIDRIE